MYSIRTILSVSLSIVIVLVGFSTAILYYYVSLEKERSDIDRFVKSESESFPVQIAHPLWKYDLDGVKMLCSERLKDTRIKSIRIVGDEKNVIFQNYYEQDTNQLTVRKEIQYDGENIGSLELIFNLSEPIDLRRRIFNIAFYILTIVVITAIASVLFLIRTLVNRPFEQIKNILLELKEEKYNWSYTEKDLKELQPIIKSLKELSDEHQKRGREIKEHTINLQKLNQTLTESQNRYQKLFDDAPVPLWEEDFTEIFNFFEMLKKKGVDDFREYFDKNPDQVGELSRKVKIIDVNYETLKLHEASSKTDLIGNLEKIFVENSLVAFKEELIALANGAETFEKEGEVGTLTGERRQVEVKLMLDNSNCERKMARLSTLDITKRKEAEAEKKVLYQKLVQAQKMESIGQLAGGIAHDFNNILYPILGFTQMVMEDLPESHPSQEDLKDILKGAKRASDLVKRILLFARQKEQVLKPTLLKPVVEEALKLMRSTIPANISILNDFYDNNYYVLCDSSEVHEIVVNLCTNAYHSIESSDGEIRIGLHKKTPPSELNLRAGDYICLSVSDNGSGIPEENIDKIFEPYFTTKDIGKGTGLGLSVVHGVVKNYNGDVEVISRKGCGTTFNLFLPITDKVDHQKPRPKLIKTGGNERILFVDDELTILKMCTQALERSGYTVTAIQNPFEALTLFRKKPEDYDLIITDMTMPGMLGSELTENIHKIRPDIPVVVCSGFSDKLENNTVKNLKINAFIDKPILMKDLIEKIRQLFD